VVGVTVYVSRGYRMADAEMPIRTVADERRCNRCGNSQPMVRLVCVSRRTGRREGNSGCAGYPVAFRGFFGAGLCHRLRLDSGEAQVYRESPDPKRIIELIGASNAGSTPPLLTSVVHIQR